LKPGSEISGVPASDTSATASPASSRASSFGRAAAIVVVIGDERRPQAVAVEQPVGNAGILAGHHVGAGQDFKRPQRHVAQIADRGRHEIQSRCGPCSLDVVCE
jgi:hypothetical protein